MTDKKYDRPEVPQPPCAGMSVLANRCLMSREIKTDHGEASFLNDFYCHVFQTVGSDLDSLCHFFELGQYLFVRDDPFVVILI